MARDLSPGTNPWYLGLQGGGVFADRARGVEHAAFVGLRVGRTLAPHWNLEFNALESRHLGSHGKPRLTLRQLSLDVLRVFDRSGQVAPFLKVGAGLLQDEPEGGDSRTNVMGEAGVGLILHLWTSENDRYSLDLRPELDVRWDGCHDCGQTMTDGLVGIGFDLSFGGQENMSRTPPPRTALRAATQQSTPIKLVLLTRVHFALNSAHSSAAPREFFDWAPAGLKANPEILVGVYSYTDSSRAAASSFNFSSRRANAVRDQLVAAGVPSAQRSAKDFDNADPIVVNSVVAGQRAYRRIAVRMARNPGNLATQKVLCGPSC